MKSYMFNGAIVFDQNIDSWQTGSVVHTCVEATGEICEGGRGNSRCMKLALKKTWKCHGSTGVGTRRGLGRARHDQPATCLLLYHEVLEYFLLTWHVVAFDPIFH